MEKCLQRLNEKEGLEDSRQWTACQEESFAEVLLPRLHRAWLKTERWARCCELDATVRETWGVAKQSGHKKD